MEIINESTQLTNIGTLTIAVYVIMELFIKPWLRAKYQVNAEGNTPNERLGRIYKAAMNTAAGILGVAFGILGAIAWPAGEAATLGTVITGLVMGAVAALTAIGTHIAASNVREWAK